MSKLKWTIKRNKEVVYQGTLKNMELFTGQARLEDKGALYAEGECQGGFKVGPWRHYHSNGQLMSRETYDAQGREQGLKELFYDDGSLWKKTTYLNAKPVGEDLNYYRGGGLRGRIIYDDKGERLSCEEFHPNGQLRLKYLFSNGRLISEQRYQEDGSPC